MLKYNNTILSFQIYGVIDMFTDDSAVISSCFPH